MYVMQRSCMDYNYVTRSIAGPGNQATQALATICTIKSEHQLLKINLIFVRNTRVYTYLSHPYLVYVTGVLITQIRGFLYPKILLQSTDSANTCSP